MGSQQPVFHAGFEMLYKTQSPTCFLFFVGVKIKTKQFKKFIVWFPIYVSKYDCWIIIFTAEWMLMLNSPGNELPSRASF